MGTDEHSSTQRWERLRQAAERKEFLAAKNGSWVRLEDGSGDDDLERRGPLARGWRRLQAVSMVVFSGRANNKQMEAPRQPEKSESDNLLAASETDLGVNHPQPRTTIQVQPLPSPCHAAKSTSNNSVPEVVVDVAPDLPRSTETAAQQADAVHVPTVDDKMKKEQQGRCIKYSQKALGFAVCTFIGYTSAVLHSRKDNSNAATFNTTFKLAVAPFFVAICTDLFSLKTKGKYGSALVFLSSFHLVLMIYIVFISFDMDYAYAIPFLPLVAGASLLQQKIWPEGQQQSTDEKVSKDLDNIFDMSTLILNWSTFITAILAVFRDVHLIPEPDEQKAFSAVGLLFFLTIVLGLYLMLVTTVRTALNLRVKCLDVLLICLLVSTLIAAVITFT